MTHNSMTPQEVKKVLTEDPSVILLDVRMISEHAHMHIADDILIPLDELNSRYKELDSSKKIIVYCASGNRSQIACDYLVSRGYECINMIGGIGAWRLAGLDVL